MIFLSRECPLMDDSCALYHVPENCSPTRPGGHHMSHIDIESQYSSLRAWFPSLCFHCPRLQVHLGLTGIAARDVSVFYLPAPHSCSSFDRTEPLSTSPKSHPSLSISPPFLFLHRTKYSACMHKVPFLHRTRYVMPNNSQAHSRFFH